MRLLSGGLVLLFLGTSAWAVQDPGLNREDLDRMQKEIDELRLRLEQEEEKDVKQEEDQDLPSKEGQKKSTLYSRLGSFSNNVHIGGYIDLEYINREDSNSDTFDQHRFVPFFYADISDAIKLSVELEIEHGEEVGIEFATVDWWLSDLVNVRAGIILLPLGKFNLVHDSPFQDLTARPLLNTWVIPSVLRDPGISLFGRIDADPVVIDYEVVISNGFKGLNKDGSTSLIDTGNGLRDARPHRDALGGGYRDFNDNKAITGRIGVSPTLGIEFGMSAHYGKYDERGDGDLIIVAADSTIKLGRLLKALYPFDFVFEYAFAHISDTDQSPVLQPEDMTGYFFELRYHFFFDALKEVPGLSEDSTFTATARLEEARLEEFVTRRFTIGLNLRPTEETVFKIEYQLNFESGDKTDVDDDAFLASIATYF